MTGQATIWRHRVRGLLSSRGLGSPRVSMRATVAILAFCLVALGLPGIALAASPHSGSVQTETCDTCHDLHNAPVARGILRDSGEGKGQAELCFLCHDGSGALGNVYSGTDSFGLSSGHVLEDRTGVADPVDLTNACSACHWPHGDPTKRPNLPATEVNSVVVGEDPGNALCLACHDDAQSWYAKKGPFPGLATPSRDTSGYPTAGTFPGATTYTDPGRNAHVGIPASTEPTRAAGDCLLCHNAHGSASTYDSLVATLAPSTASSVAYDRATGDYAALCFECHAGGDWAAKGAPNIRQYVTQNAADVTLAASSGHRIKSSGGTLPPNAPLPCYDCHNPHGSSRGNQKLLSDSLGASLDTAGGAEAVRRFCLTCHVSSDLLGWNSAAGSYTSVPATASVEGLLRRGGASNSGPDGGYNWLRLRPTTGHAAADITLSCYECHGGEYGAADSNNVHNPASYSVALHTATPSSASISIKGTSYGPYACTECHSVELGPEHVKASSSSSAAACGACHPTPRSTLTPWNHATCVQGGCHTVSTSVPMHAEVDADHNAPAVACTVAGCHTASLGLAAIHSEAATTVAGDERTSCEVCHAASVPATNNCMTCHPGDPHGGANHTVGGPCTPSGCHVTDARTIHENGPGCAACHAPGKTASFACRDCHSDPHPEANHGGAEECGACHSVGKLTTVHGDNCALCHPIPAQGMTYTGTCMQCHTTAHSGQLGHYVWDNHGYGDDCWSCHPADGGNCDSCHTPEYERAAPITTSDARANYTTLAFIRLYPVDQAGPWGWASGVRATYYQIDGGALQTGTTVVVPGPASGTATHTVEFWSTDNQYNTEAHNIVHFRITAGAADTNPPTGTMSINNNAVYANTTIVTVNSNVTDAETGIAGMRVDPGSGTYGAWMDYSPNQSIMLDMVNGTKTVHVQYKDAGGNILTLTDTIILDNQAPTGTMVMNAGAAYTNNRTVTVSSAVTDSFTGVVDMRFMDNGNWIWGAWEPYVATKTYTLNGTFSGTRNLYVQYRDAAGNVLQLLDTIAYDTTAPTGTMSVNNNATYATSTSVTLNSAVTDTGGSLLKEVRIDPGSGTFGSWVTYSSSVAFTLATGDGTKTVRAEYRDGAGNVLAKTDTIILDTGAPTGTMVVASGAATTSVTAVNVNSSMTDAGSGISQMRIDPGTGTYGSWVAYAATYPITLPSGDGLKTVRVEYRDNCSFVATKTDTIYLNTAGTDTTPPTGTISIAGGASTTATTAVTLTLSASDTGGSGLTQMRFSNDNVTWSAWQAYSTTKSWTLLAGNGDRTVYAQFRDGALNVSTTCSDDIRLLSDTVVGTTNVALTDYTWLDAEYGAWGGWGTYSIYVDGVFIGSKAADGTSTWNCPQVAVSPGARIDIVVDVGFTNPGYVWDANAPLTFTTYLPAAATHLVAGTWTGFPALEVNDSWYDDYGGDYTYVLIPPGTISGIAYSMPSGADLVAPTGTVTINGGAANTNVQAVTLALSATDTGGSNLSQMRFSNDGVTWSAWETYATSKAWTLSAGNETKTVYVQYRDGTGNVSTNATDSILYDGTAPTGSIAVAGGASWTTLTTTLNLSATDVGGSGVAQMRFSNDGVTWSAWDTYATTKTWSLTAGAGAKTVYAQFSDGAGNLSSAYSDGVWAEGVAPTGWMVADGGAIATSNSAVTLTLSANDTGGSGLSQMRFSSDGVTWTSWETYATTKAWTLSSGDGLKYIYAQFRDLSGNVSATYLDTIFLSSAGTSTLSFQWWGYGYAELHLEDAAGQTIASTWVEGSGSDLQWDVVVPSGQIFYMVCDYYEDWDWGGSGGGYGVWTTDVSINPDSILSPGETVVWNY